MTKRWSVTNMVWGASLAAYPIIAAISALIEPCGNDLGLLFLPGARFVAAGRVLDIYQVFVGANPNTNGPFANIVLGGALMSGRVLNVQSIAPRCPANAQYPLPGDSIPLRMWLTAVIAVIVIGMASEVFRIMERWQRSTVLSSWRYIVWGLLLLNPLLWLSVVYYGHIETVIACWLSLAAVRLFLEQRLRLCGMVVGLALLSRPTTAFVIIPLVLVLVREHHWHKALHFVIAICVVVLIGVLPFYLHDTPGTTYALMTFRGNIPIGDGSIWTIFRGTTWRFFLKYWDTPLQMLAAVIMSVLLLWRGRIASDDPRLYGVICVSACCFPLLVKVEWGYYFFEAFVWALAWLLAKFALAQHWHQVVLVPLFFLLLVTLNEVRIVLAGDIFAEMGTTRILVITQSLLAGLALFTFMLWLASALLSPHSGSVSQ